MLRYILSLFPVMIHDFQGHDTSAYHNRERISGKEKLLSKVQVTLGFTHLLVQ